MFLCNRTIFFLQAEKIIDDDLYAGVRHVAMGGHYGQQKSVETARTIHHHALQVLRNLVEKPEENQSLVERLETLVDRYPAHYPPIDIWERIEVLVSHDLEQDSKPGQPHDEARNIDDVIIYRCLMVILLFQTAPDSSQILESGLWDMVVPFI